ncbi:MAG: nitrilase [Bdellovibrionaceae bacterium]|nr:nitrilase [Pseudobdellovibrionaceae bacterium]
MENLNYKISLAQYPILFHSRKQDWYFEIEKWFINAKKSQSRLIVFPEYGSLDLISLLAPESRDTLKIQLEELQTLHDFFLKTFIDFSSKYSIYSLAPSFPLKIGKKFFNRSYFVSPSGSYNFQDKIHMTRFEESWGISESETELKVFDTQIGRIGIQICFDIEFPWPTSLLARHGVKLVLNPSCTEGISGLNRVHIGAKSRALENQILVGISQTVGHADWSPAVDINNGIAAIYAPSDKFFPENGILAQGQLNTIGLVSHEIDLAKVEKVRLEGDVFNFKKNQEYPWTKVEQKNLEIKIVALK